MTFSRRRVLQGAAAASALGVLGGGSWARADGVTAHTSYAPISPLPSPASSGIEHVVVVMMENRSFDHLLGWLPGADGKTAGLSYLNRYGVRHPTHHVSTFNTCGHPDPDHSYEGGRVELNNGRCDGWLRAGENDTACIGYFEKADLPFLGQAASHWTTFDRYFSAVLAETYPNRFYQHSARTDRLHNNTDQATMPTIWDRLAGKGVSGTYYFSDVPFLALWRDKYLSIAKPFAQFLADATTGTLPAVSFVDPRFEDEDSGTSNDDHPHADIRAGEDFLNQVYNAVRQGRGWEKTVLVVNFDEWGGFFDHVAPALAPDVSPTTSRRGFRVPAVMISPLARRNAVNHYLYDHTSILKMIEWRWGLAPLTPRDKAARNIAEALDFSAAPRTASPTFTVAPFVPVACEAPRTPQQRAAEYAEWPALRQVALDNGWTLP